MPWPKSPLVEIAGLAAGMSLLVPMASMTTGNSPGAAMLLGAVVTYAIPITLALWVTGDLRSRGQTPPFELPFLLLLCWPISLAWYCVWTRGWKGLILAGGLFVLTYVPHFVTMILFAGWMVVSQ